MTESLKLGLNAADVHRSAGVQPAGPWATAMRRMPTPPIASPAVIRRSPSAVTAGCIMRVSDGHEYFQSSLPSDGATLVAPGALISRICGTPWMVTRWGEL